MKTNIIYLKHYIGTKTNTINEAQRISFQITVIIKPLK